MEDESSSRIFTVVVAVVDELRFKLEEAWGASPADWAISNGESRFTSVYFVSSSKPQCVGASSGLGMVAAAGVAGAGRWVWSPRSSTRSRDFCVFSSFSRDLSACWMELFCSLYPHTMYRTHTLLTGDADENEIPRFIRHLLYALRLLVYRYRCSSSGVANCTRHQDEQMFLGRVGRPSTCF